MCSKIEVYEIIYCDDAPGVIPGMIHHNNVTINVWPKMVQQALKIENWHFLFRNCSVHFFLSRRSSLPSSLFFLFFFNGVLLIVHGPQ